MLGRDGGKSTVHAKCCAARPVTEKRPLQTQGLLRFLCRCLWFLNADSNATHMPAPTAQDALTLPVAAKSPGVSVGGADRCDDHANMSVVVMVRLRRLRSREGCETKGDGTRKSNESFGRNSHDEPRMLCV